jgi:hypothetical protein
MSTERSQGRGKIGDGTLKAMGRLGLNELRATVFNPSGNIAQPLEPGMFGNPTPGEIAKDRQSMVDERVRSAQERTEDAERNEPEAERDL